MDDDQMILNMLNKKRMEMLGLLAMYHQYGGIDAETRDRLIQRVDETFDAMAGYLATHPPST